MHESFIYIQQGLASHNGSLPLGRFQIGEIYFEKKNKSVSIVYRALRRFYGQHNRPSEEAIRVVTVVLALISLFLIQDHPQDKGM